LSKALALECTSKKTPTPKEDETAITKNNNASPS